jgi:glycosyltransferase involved in cell wall biosynthesis
MRVVHSVGSIDPRHGGPSRTIPGLCRALTEVSVDVTLLARETCQPHRHATVLWRRIRRHEFDVVHDHGLWLPTNHVAALASRRAGVPLVISPRGMLGSWELRFKGWKKRLAWRVYQARDARSARLIHVTSADEGEAVRAAGIKSPLAVIPNGVEVPAQRVRPMRPRRRALFLSRIHPKKGILTLVTAWAQIRPPAWELMIVGPDADGHKKSVEDLVRAEGLSDVITVAPATSDEEKWETYADADLFVLPTFSENFGIVVAEALASGLPVITTTAAPWEAVATHKLGWWTDVGLEPLAIALREATSMSDDQRHELGRRGREYVIRHFSWLQVGQEMRAVYEWLLQGGQRPGSVSLD